MLMGCLGAGERSLDVEVDRMPSYFAWLPIPYVLVAVGGALGSVVRYGVGRGIAMQMPGAASMWGTGCVNVLGSFVLGCVVMGIGANPKQHGWVLFLGVGFCGGLTTFSTLAMELADLIHARRWLDATGWGLGSLVLGVVSFLLGIWVMRGE